MSFLPTTVHRFFYVSQTGDDLNDGSLTNPFATINGALSAANQYADSDNIVIEVGPGTYPDDITVTRYNTYIKSSTSRYEQRAVTVTGKTLVNYTGPQDKYNRVIGFQGIFFNHNSLTNPTLHISGSRNLTYLKDCYLASNGANTLKIENVTTASAKVVVANCAFLGQKGGADLINIAGGDIKIDTVEAYFSPGTTGVGNGIVQSGSSLVAADRVLVDLSSTITGSAIVNGSTNYTGRPTLYLSNSSLTSTQVTTNGAVYSTNVSYLWNVALTDNSKIKGNAPNPFSAVLYSNLTSTNALNFETISRSYYLKNYTGDVVANSFTGSLSGSVTGVFSGNGSGLTNISSSNWSGGTDKFAKDVKSLLSGGFGITYDTGSGVISAVSVFNGAETSGSITGSGVAGNPIILKDNIEVVSVTASAGFYGYLDGTASYALNAAIDTSLFAKKNEDNTFTAKNYYTSGSYYDGLNASLLLRESAGIKIQYSPQDPDRVTGDITLSRGDTGGNIYVTGGKIYAASGGIEANTGASIEIKGTGHFSGSGAGLKNLSGSNWGPLHSFTSDVRNQFFAGEGIEYNLATGEIKTNFSTDNFVTRPETSSFVKIDEENTFTANQHIEVDSAAPAFTVSQINAAGNIAEFYSNDDYPAPTIIDKYANLNIKADSARIIPTDNALAQRYYALNVKGGITQDDIYAVGISQVGFPIGLTPMIVRQWDGLAISSNDSEYRLNGTGRMGLFVKNNGLIHMLPTRWNSDENQNDPPRVFYYEIGQINERGNQGDYLFRLENNGEVTFKNRTGTTLFNIKDNGEVSASAKFIGNGSGLTDLSGSSWGPANSFFDDVLSQLVAGEGIDIDRVTGEIKATGVGAGLGSKGNITGSGNSGNEFDLIDDITVISVTAENFYGTASIASDAVNLAGIDGGDYTRYNVTNTFTVDQEIQANLSASTIQGDGSGLINLTGSNWGPDNDFATDVWNQLSAGNGIDFINGVISTRAPGEELVLTSSNSNLIGSGTTANPLALNDDIDLNSVTANTFIGTLNGNASTATDASNLGGAAAANYARLDGGRTNNFYSANNFNTGLTATNVNTFNATNTSIGGSSTVNGGSIVASYPLSGSTNITGGRIVAGGAAGTGFFGVGSGLTDLTASSWSTPENWYSDVASAFLEGAGVTFDIDALTGKTFINSAGGAGAIITSGSITGSGTGGDPLTLKNEITASSAHFNYIDFETGSVVNPDVLQGRLFYNNNADVNGLSVYTDIQDVAISLGEQLVLKVKNNGNYPISKGKVVYISGASGANPIISTSSYDSEQMSARTLGVVMQDLEENDFGYVLLRGILTDINTDGMNPGASLFLNSSGNYSITKPQAPNHDVRIGNVVRGNNLNNGSIFVNIQNGYELDEIHDVRITNKLNGDLLTWDSGSLYWKNGKILSGSYNIVGGLTASAGFYSTVTSDMKVTRALTADTTTEANVVRDNTENVFTALNTFNSNVIFGAGVDVQFNGNIDYTNPQNFSSGLTASNAYISNNLYVNGTASIAHLNTIEQTALQIGDKYIILASSSANHSDLDQGGILWGSGSVSGPSAGPAGEHAYIRYDLQHDHLHIFPGLHVSGALTSSTDVLIEGSLIANNDITANAYYGDGSSLTGVNAVSSNNTVTIINTTNIDGTIDIGSAVSFSGSYLCAADQANDRKSNIVGIVSSIDGDTYTITTSGQVSGSNGGDFIGGDIVYVGSNGLLSNYDNIPVGAYITQVGIASLDASTTGNILLQPRIYGQK